MLLASGYRLVDEMASTGIAGDNYAVAFIGANAGSLFSATPEERRNPGLLRGPLTLVRIPPMALDWMAKSISLNFIIYRGCYSGFTQDTDARGP